MRQRDHSSRLCRRACNGQNVPRKSKSGPDGKFLYGSNRGHDSIAVFALDPQPAPPSCLQTVPTGGKTPRNFEIAPDGSYLVAGQPGSNNVVVFKVDQRTGH